MGFLKSRKGYTIIQIAIAIVVIAGIIALVWLGLSALHVQVPEFVISALWIIFIVAVIIMALLALAWLWNYAGGPRNPPNNSPGAPPQNH